MALILAAVLAFLLDLLLGDPDKLPHPVVWMGKAIGGLEKGLRKRFSPTPRGELTAGTILVLSLTLGTLAMSLVLLWVAAKVHILLWFALEVFWGWQVLALKGLRQESYRVYTALVTGTLPQARQAVARIVGRDTQCLDEAGVTRAAVETVAENFSDGVAAPLFYYLIGGAPLALCYKAVNTMDSMVGYRTERYLYFGRPAARLDDAANYLPARLSALLLVAAAWLLGEDGRGAWRIWRRDRRNHASPNSAQTEAAMAGALNIRLAGPASYFGKRVDKPTIGDDIRPIQAADILRSNRLLYGAGVLSLVLFAALRGLVVIFVLAGGIP
ncbi:MAG TPA: adenosylcobinamide-phosphate synthase CbiB [Candidatus Evtepia faecigallinarum]|nr:adenosylcobinamide-phosphate synthase CbiB [Candidatus Evtepia faecigallinarum]